MEMGRGISAQIRKIEHGKSRKRNKNKMLKVFKRGVTASSFGEKEMREEIEPSRKISHTHTHTHTHTQKKT